MTKKLFKCYSRLLIDSHISDQKPEYMSRFSPREYVRMVKLSGVESAMVYAADHNGNCYYPTKVGHPHGGMKDRDFFGETVALLKKNGIAAIAYYTVIYNNDCAKRFPAARLVNRCGESRDGRYHFTCPNQPQAREFYREQIREILQYDLDGLFIDMTFWPSICFCDACRKKYGKPFPERIDWSSPEWISFQRFRENSMAEFAEELTLHARKCKPGISVTHQFSPVLHGWYLGQSDGIAEASDYASGDFYGGKLQQRFAVKAFDAYTRHAPFEFMTSRCVSLRDHTSSKSEEELFLSALTTLANGGAYFFIDAINPDGTLEESFYRRFHRLNERLKPFRECLEESRFRLTARVGLWFSILCCVDKTLNGQELASFRSHGDNMALCRNPILEEVLGTAEILNRMHIPYKVLKGGGDFSGLDAIIINNAVYLSAEECDQLRRFVRAGGTLIATGETSLRDPSGNTSGNFRLSDLFGVDFSGGYSDVVTYFGEERILSRGRAPLVAAAEDVQVRDCLTFPDFPCHDPDCYASIHSDPPGDQTGYPAWTVHRYGAGKCVFLAPPVLLLRQYTQQEFGKKLFREFLPRTVVSSRNLPESAEVTLLASADASRHLLCIVNAQNELPAIPLRDVELQLALPFPVRRIVRVADGSEVKFGNENGLIRFAVPEIQAGEFCLLE